MANRIKGITVEIGGDTTKLQTALKGVNGQIKNTQSTLRDVEKLLKLDPHNTELLSQKQKLLTQAISETKDKLATLKTAAEQANEQLQKGEITQEQYNALQREIAETEAELKKLESQASKTNQTLTKIGEKTSYIKQLQQNITDVIKSSSATATAEIDAKLEALQKDLIKKANKKDSYDEIADEILKLREEHQQLAVDTSVRDDQIERIKEIQDFIRSQRTDISEFDEALIRRWIKQITVYNDHFTVELKSGLSIDIDE